MVTSGIDDALAHHANLASKVCPVIDTAKFHLIIQVAMHLRALRATRLSSEQSLVIDTPKVSPINRDLGCNGSVPSREAARSRIAPLHTNGSERDIRDHVKKQKVSGGTRSELGRQCRDTFSSLKKTCRKLGISFWNYLTDRISCSDHIPPLPHLVEQRLVHAA